MSLPSTDSMFWYSIDLPATLLGQAWGFFRAVWEQRKSEAMVDITWSRKHGYRLFVPPQNTSMGGVKARRNPEHYRGQIVGTIHSHCNFGAYHSGTDHGDADNHDGLHMTIGHVDAADLDIAIMVSDNKKKWDLKLEDITREKVTIQPFPAWWLKLVDDPEPPKPAATPPVTQHPALTLWQNVNKPAPTQAKADDSAAFERILDSHLTQWEAMDALAMLDELQGIFEGGGLVFDYELAVNPRTPPKRIYTGPYDYSDEEVAAAFSRFVE